MLFAPSFSRLPISINISLFNYRLTEAYEDDTSDDGSSSGFEREQRAKQETNDLIKKQFALRKNPKVILSLQSLLLSKYVFSGDVK